MTAAATKRKGVIACGAGVIITVSANDTETVEIARFAIPLPEAEDALEAEACGAAKSCTEVIQLLQRKEYREMKVIIQGDNKPVIDYNKGLTRLRNPMYFKLFSPIFEALQRANIPVQWQHIPREQNVEADAAANEAAFAILNGTAVGNTDIDGCLIRRNGRQEGKDAKDKTKQQITDDAVEYLQKISNGVKPEQPLFLPETYQIDPARIDQTLSRKELATILRFLRQRHKLASYEAAKGHSALSRHYNRNGGIVGGGVNKKSRYLLLKGHYEADLVACFHTISRAFSGKHGNQLLRPTPEAKRFINSQLSPKQATETVAKVILQRIITASASAIVSQVYAQFGVTLGPILRIEIERFYKMRSQIVENMHKAGLYGTEDDSVITDANRLYFPCEAAETAIMAGALKRLMQRNEIKSLVWLHDGMYISKDIPHAETLNAIREAASEVGIPDVEIKFTDCEDAARSLPAAAPDPANVPLINDIQKILYGRSNQASTLMSHEQATLNVDIHKPLGRYRSAYKKK